MLKQNMTVYDEARSKDLAVLGEIRSYKTTAESTLTGLEWTVKGILVNWSNVLKSIQHREEIRVKGMYKGDDQSKQNIL